MDSDASEEHMAQDKFREKTLKYKRTVDSSLSNAFESLVSPSVKDRSQAAATIGKYLLSKQVSQSEELCSDLLHVLRRLIRGVGTPREDARIGFYATLVSLLALFPKITVPKVLEIINKELVGGGAVTKSEKAEQFTGHVLTYGAVIQSGLLKTASFEDQQLVLTNLMTVASKRDYLPSHAFSFLIQFSETVPRSAFKRVVWPVLEPLIAVPWPQQTHNTLNALLWATERYPKILNDDFYVKHLEDDFTCTTSLKHCLLLLMTPPRRAYLEHPVYETFCQRLVSTNQVVAFFDDVLDPYLADRAASGAADMAAAKILLFSARHIKDKSQVCSLLNKQVLQLLMRYSQRKRKNVDLITDALVLALNEIVATLKGAEDDHVVDVVQRLLYGSELANSYQVVRQVVPLLGKPGVLRLLDIHRALLESDSGKKKKEKEKPAAEPASGVSTENGFATAARGYAQLLAHPVLQKDQKQRAQLTKPLIVLGFLADEGVSHLRATQVRTAFFKTLDQRTPNLSALREYLVAVVKIVHKLVFAADAKPRDPLRPDVAQAWARMQEAAATLGGKTKVAAAPLFHTMFLHLGLMLLMNNRSVTEALEELHSCLERAVQDSTKRRKKVVLSEGALEEGEPEWVEVAVELLLSLLSHSAHLLRKLVACVFPHLIPHLTPSSLHQILSVLDVNSEQSLLRESDESASESEEEGEEDDDEDEGDDDDKEEEDGDDEGMSSESDAGPVNERLKVALRQALWPAGTVPDSEDEDIEPNEEEGAKLNEALANAFREFCPSKPGGRNASKQSREEEALMHFRTRVMDVLEAVLAATPPMSTCLDAIPPLMQLLQHCIQDPHLKALENRVRSCLGRLSSIRTWRDTEGVTPARLVALLDSVLDKGDRTAPLYLDMLPNTIGIATFILRCSHHIGDGDRSAAPGVTDRYLRALEEFMTRRECLHNVKLYAKAMVLPWSGNLELAASLVDFAFAPIRPFRCAQALELLSIFLSSRAHGAGAENFAQRKEIVMKLLHNSRKLFTEKTSTPNPPLRGKYLLALTANLRTALAKTGSPDEPHWRKLGKALAGFVYAGGAHAALPAVKALAAKLSLTLDMGKIQPAAQRNAKTATVAKGKITNGNASEEEHNTTEGHETTAATNGISHSEDEDEEENDRKVAKRKRKDERKLKWSQRLKETPADEVGSQKLSKKASRELRQTAMSEGFAETVFSTDLRMDADDEDDAVKENEVKVNGESLKKKKKKSKKRTHEGEEVSREAKKKKSKNKT